MDSSYTNPKVLGTFWIVWHRALFIAFIPALLDVSSSMKLSPYYEAFSQLVEKYSLFFKPER
jgi:hypothetical protein